MTVRIEVTDRAQRDIERNAQWWARHHSAQQAAEWFDTVHAQLRTLIEFPESYAVSTENDDFPYTIRDKRVGLGKRPSYRAVFTIREQIVYVLTILRFAQDRLRPDQVDK